MTQAQDTDEDDGTPDVDAVIALRRDRRGARDLLRPYRVMLDGGEVMQIRRGQTFEFDVLPGRHTVQIVSGEDSSQLVSLDLSTGGRAAFVCGPARGPEAATYRITLNPE